MKKQKIKAPACAVSLAVSAVLVTSSIGGAFAQSQTVTVGDYFNKLSADQRVELLQKVKTEETNKMLDAGKVAEMGCVVEKISVKADGSPGEGLIRMADTLELARRKGLMDVSAERVMRTVMLGLFKECVEELKEKGTQTAR